MKVVYLVNNKKFTSKEAAFAYAEKIFKKYGIVVAVEIVR